MGLADFHVHSIFSDGKLGIADVVDLYGRRGFGAIAITDPACEAGRWRGQAARARGRYRRVVLPDRGAILDAIRKQGIRFEFYRDPLSQDGRQEPLCVPALF